MFYILCTVLYIYYKIQDTARMLHISIISLYLSIDTVEVYHCNLLELTNTTACTSHRVILL